MSAECSFTQPEPNQTDRTNRSMDGTTSVIQMNTMQTIYFISTPEIMNNSNEYYFRLFVCLLFFRSRHNFHRSFVIYIIYFFFGCELFIALKFNSEINISTELFVIWGKWSKIGEFQGDLIECDSTLLIWILFSA